MASHATEEHEDGIALGVVTALAGYHLRRASSVFGLDFARALAGTGMRQVLFAILSVVDANPGINQGAAGRALGVQRANMVALINELVDKGWLERKVGIADRRAFALTISETGRSTLTDCLVRIRQHEERMLSYLDASDRRQLLQLLAKIEAKEI